MDNIKKDIKNLDEYELPNGLHGQIMRRLLLYRAFRPLFATILVLAINTMLLSWNIYAKTAELQTLSIVSAMLDGFSLTWSFMNDFSQSLIEALPMIPIIALICNIIVGFYVIRILLILSKFNLKQRAVNIEN